MTIDGVNISEYGLEVIGLEDHLNQPARKKTLDVPGLEENDIVFEAKEPTVVLFGEYESTSAMKSGIDAFYAKIRSALKHDYILIGHGLSFRGVVANGIRPEIINTCITMKLTITITQ